MANSYVRYTGNGSTTQFSIPFSYIDSAHIACTVAGVSTSFTLDAAGTTATLSSAPANGAAIEFKRTSSQTSRLTDYQAGSVLKEADLDNDSLQGFFMSQEAIDDANDVISTDNTDFQWDVNNKRLKNVATPTASTDAATKGYIDTSTTSAATSATNAATSATAAASSATAAATSETNAATSATNAASSATSASGSATTATTQASAASTSATNAASSASNASTSETNAASSATTASTHASTASTQATNAASSASSASTSATNAATSATSASTAQTAAETAKTAAETAQAAAETALDTFDDKFLGSKASNPTVDNDGNALTDGALYFDTTNNVMKVYDLGNTQWKQLTPTSSQQTNIDTVATNISNVNTTATNISGVNSFAERYRVSSSDPSTSLDEGDLVYNSTDNQIKYYNGSSWVAISADTDVKTKVSSNDTTAGFLNGKLVAGSNITFTENSDGGNETLTIAGSDNSIPFAIALG